MAEKRTHVITDESLGGIQREYTEVERKADVGDYVIVHGEGIEKVIGHIDLHTSGIELAEYWVGEGEYRTLTPTDIVHVDGSRYRMVERKADVGERVVVVEYGSFFNAGDIFTVEKTEYTIPAVGNHEGNVLDGRYRVLEPLESEATEPITVDESHASPQVIAMLANLAQRIVALEKAKEPVDYDTIPTFKYSDLNGKTLRIYSAQDVNGEFISRVVMGVDEDTGKTYLLSHETEVVE